MTTATRHDVLAPKTPLAAEEGYLDGTALVLGYIEARVQGKDLPPEVASLIEELLRRVKELSARLAELAGVEQQAAALSKSLEALKAHNEKLQETIRVLEIGFQRHVSQRISPEQLHLALFGEPGTPSSPATPSPLQTEGGEASMPSNSVETGEPSPLLAGPPGQTGAADAPSGSDPRGQKPKKRDNHGRRRIGVIPRVILETVPPDVLLKGIELFERVGAEDSSLLGYRRGGAIELILRRPKYVLRTASSADAGVTLEQPSPSNAPSFAGEQPALASEQEEALVVREHEALMVPADPGFKRSPFVDGAIVRYVPEPADSEGDEGPVWIAPVPERPINRCLADPSLLAHVFLHKLDYHTPYYRQEVESDRYGFRFGRATMARWQFECGKIAMRIADAMWTDALTRSWFAMDATGTAILAKEKYRYGHIFVLVAPGDGVLFRYTPHYDGPTVKELFGGYQGIIVADASASHNGLFGPGKAREGGCWSHGRKRFVEAFRAGEDKEAAFALQIIQALFRIEEEAALCSPDERLAIRQCRSAPLVKSLFDWVEQQLLVVPEHALLRVALVYLRNQKDALCEFLLNGEIPIHNNASERALRRVVKGRKNWLFHGSDEHARRACALSSLIASCEMHGLDPELYLQEVLTVAPSYPLSRALDLSPKNWVETRKRLIAEGRLKYLDLAQITGSRLLFRAR